MNRRIGTAAAVLAVGCVVMACAPRAEMAASEAAPAPQAPPPPAAVDPVGTYNFSTIFQGGPLTGRIVIRGEPGRYTGMLTPASGPGPVTIYSLSVEGQTMTLFGDADGDDLIVTMTFTGDSYTGTWALGFDGGEMSGSRVKPEP